MWPTFPWGDHLRLTFWKRGNCKQPTCFSHFFFATEKLWNIGVWPWPAKTRIKSMVLTADTRGWPLINENERWTHTKLFACVSFTWFYDIKWNSNFNIEFHSFGFVASCEDWNQAITHLRFKDKDPWKKLLDSIMFHHRTPHQQTRNKSTKHRITYVYINISTYMNYIYILI